MVLSKPHFQDLHPWLAGMCLGPKWELLWGPVLEHRLDASFWVFILGKGNPSVLQVVHAACGLFLKLKLTSLLGWAAPPSPCFLHLIHSFPPSLSQEISPVWNPSHPLSSTQIRLCYLLASNTQWPHCLCSSNDFTWGERSLVDREAYACECLLSAWAGHSSVTDHIPFVSLAPLSTINVLPWVHWFGRHVYPSTID